MDIFLDFQKIVFVLDVSICHVDSFSDGLESYAFCNQHKDDDGEDINVKHHYFYNEPDQHWPSFKMIEIIICKLVNQCFSILVIILSSHESLETDHGTLIYQAFKTHKHLRQILVLVGFEISGTIMESHTGYLHVDCVSKVLHWIIFIIIFPKFPYL